MQKLSKWRPVELGNHKRRFQGTTVLMGILDVEHCETMFSGVGNSFLNFFGSVAVGHDSEQYSTKLQELQVVQDRAWSHVPDGP